MHHGFDSQTFATSVFAARSRRATRRAGLAAAICAWAAAAHAQPLPFTESFGDQSLRDASATRASWGERTPGRLELGTSAPLAALFSESTPAVDLPGSFTTRSLALGDLDGDGDLDLAEGATPRSGVYLWDAAARAFTARADLEAASANTRGIAIADVDGDGDLDVAAGNLNQRPRLFLNAGDGITFTAFDISPDVRRSDSIALVDANGDGLIDVVTGNQRGFANALFLNTGDPLQPFGPRGVPPIDISTVTDHTQHLVWGDVDNDGDVDFVALNENQPNRLHLRLGDGTFSSTPIGFEADDSQSGALGDLNGDGFLDLVVANSMPPQVNKIYLNTADPTSDALARFTSTGVPFTVPDDPSYGHSVQLADADDDGDLDIFLSTAGPFQGTQTNRLYLNDGSGLVFTSVTIGSAMDITNTGAVGDLDGDGDLDYVAGNEARDANNEALPAINRLYFNEGTPQGAPVAQLRGVATSLKVADGPVTSVRLRVDPAALGRHNQVDFWVSANGGLGWVHAVPDRPVAFPPSKQGADLRWRAVVSARSPSAAEGAAFFGVDDVTLEPNLTAPSRAAPIGDQSATQGTAFGPLDASFTDADGDRVFHALTGLPADTGLTIDPLTGAIAGTPTNADAMASPIAVTLTATDGGLRTEQTFTFNVANVNDAPGFASTAVETAASGVAYAYAVTAADPDVGDVVTITASLLPAWLTLVDNGGGSATLSGTPGEADVGVHDVSLLATDAGGLTATQSFAITVSAGGPAPNASPTIALNGAATITLDLNAAFNDPGATASDAEDGDLTASIVVDNPVNTGVAGTYTVTYSVEDSAGATATARRTVIVRAPPAQNPAPPPSTPGGGGGGGGATTLPELLGLAMALVAALRARRFAKPAPTAARVRCM